MSRECCAPFPAFLHRTNAGCRRDHTSISLKSIIAISGKAQGRQMVLLLICDINTIVCKQPGFTRFTLSMIEAMHLEQIPPLSTQP
jgi:hypothetical protein